MDERSLGILASLVLKQPKKAKNTPVEGYPASFTLSSTH
jgi:hypothetical protein